METVAKLVDALALKGRRNSQAIQSEASINIPGAFFLQYAVEGISPKAKIHAGSNPASLPNLKKER